MTERQNWYCLICKKLLKKKRKYAPKLVWFLTWSSEKEAIEHIRKEHPKIYKEIIKDDTEVKQC